MQEHLQAADPQAPVPLTAQPVAPATTVAPAVQAQISAPPSGDIRYQNKRLLVLDFDGSSMGPADFIGGRGEAIAYTHLSRVCREGDLPYFWPHYLGEKCETFDFLVDQSTNGARWNSLGQTFRVDGPIRVTIFAEDRGLLRDERPADDVGYLHGYRLWLRARLSRSSGSR